MRVSSARFFTDLAGKVEADLTTLIDTTAAGFNRADHQILITLGDGVTYDIKRVTVDDLTADVVQVPDIVLQRKGTTGSGTVIGRVIDQANRPVANVQVTLRAGVNLGVGDFAAVSDSATARLVVTDANGNFAISGLRATEFTVRLRGSTIFQRLQPGLNIQTGSSVSQDFVVTARSCPAGTTLQDGGCVGASIAVGTLNIAGGESYPFRANFTINSSGLINGGNYDFHKLDGTMTACTYGLANAATCHGVSGDFSVTSQSGNLTVDGAASAMQLKAGPDGYGYMFTGTITGKNWLGTWIKMATTLSPSIGSGTFSSSVGIVQTSINTGIIKPLAVKSVTSSQTEFTAGLAICVVKSVDVEYDSAIVFGPGLPEAGLRLVSNPVKHTCLSRDDFLDTMNHPSLYVDYALPRTLAPNEIPSGSIYVVRKYLRNIDVGSYSVRLGSKVLAPAEVAGLGFPTLLLSTYGQLCPDGAGYPVQDWWALPVGLRTVFSGSVLSCRDTEFLGRVYVRDDFGNELLLRQEAPKTLALP